MLTTDSVTVNFIIIFLHCGSIKSDNQFVTPFSVFLDVRLAALEAIVDYARTDGREDDVMYLLDILETDAVPAMRHDLCRLIVQCLSEKTVNIAILLTRSRNVVKFINTNSIYFLLNKPRLTEEARRSLPFTQKQ